MKIFLTLLASAVIAAAQPYMLPLPIQSTNQGWWQVDLSTNRVNGSQSWQTMNTNWLWASNRFAAISNTVAPFDYSRIHFRDEFILSPESVSGGGYMDSGWKVLLGTGGGVSAAPAEDWPRIGVAELRITSTANQGTRIYASPNGASSAYLNTAKWASITNWDQRFAIRIIDTNTVMAQFGVARAHSSFAVSTNCTTNCVTFFYHPTNNHWFVRSFHNNALTITDTGVVATEDWTTFRMTSTISNQFQCYVGATGPILVTNTTTLTMAPIIEMFGTATYQYMNVDFWELFMWGLSR